MDVGLISWPRHKQAILYNEIYGGPDLVVEIIFPLELSVDVDEKEAFCLDHGCQSFWLVNPASRTVKITHPPKHGKRYTVDQTIDMLPFAAEPLPVADIVALVVS